MSNKKYLFCKILFTLPFKNIYLQSQWVNTEKLAVNFRFSMLNLIKLTENIRFPMVKPKKAAVSFQKKQGSKGICRFFSPFPG